MNWRKNNYTFDMKQLFWFLPVADRDDKNVAFLTSSVVHLPEYKIID